MEDAKIRENVRYFLLFLKTFSRDVRRTAVDGVDPFVATHMFRGRSARKSWDALHVIVENRGFSANSSAELAAVRTGLLVVMNSWTDAGLYTSLDSFLQYLGDLNRSNTLDGQFQALADVTDADAEARGAWEATVQVEWKRSKDALLCCAQAGWISTTESEQCRFTVQMEMRV